jgi:hypothetical protein
MSVFSGPALLKKEYPLIPTGEYVVTLNDLTYETGGTYGDSLLWKWLIAEVSTPTDYLARDDGNEKVHHEYTNPDIIVGSKSHEWIAALSGIVLGEGDEPPDSDDLIGKRMKVYITHLAPKKGPNAGKLRERFVDGSAKPFNLVPPKRVAHPQAERPAAAPVEQDRAALRKRVDKLIGKAVMLDTPHHLDYVAVDLDNTSDDDLTMLANTIEAEVKAAVEA